MKTFLTKRRSSALLRSEINVTPFVDVMLVLLIIFMVTAPMMTTGISVDLPESQTSPELQQKQEPLTVVLNSKGQCFLKEKEVSFEQLLSMLKSLPKSEEQRLYIKADQKLAYSQVMQLMTFLIGAGYNKIALITQKESSTK